VGGSLAESTVDGWVCRRTSHGVELIGPLGDIVEVTDGEECRAFGFSPDGSIFVYATSPTLTILLRTPLSDPA
jgi:hypothetical protein